MYNFEEKRSSLIATLVMLFIAIHEIKNEDSFLHENILSKIQRNYELDDIEDKIINQAEDAYKRLYDSIEDKELKKKVKERKNEIIDFYNKVKDEIPEYQDWFYEAVMGKIKNETGFTTTTLIEKKTAEVEKSIYYDYVENENANGVSFQCADYYEIGERAYNGDKDAQEKVIDVFATWSILASERIRTSNSELMESDLKDNLTIGHLKNSILIGLTLYESGWGADGMEELRERNNLGGMNWGFISSVDFNKDLTVDCYKLNPNYDELAPEYYLSIKPEEILPYWTTYASPDDERYIVYVDNGNSLKYWRGYEDVLDFMEDQQRFLLGKNPAIADPNLSAKEILTKYADTFDTYGTGAKNILRMIETYNLEERFDKPEVIAQYLNQEGTRIKKVNFETYSFSDEELSKLAALIEAKEGATIYNMRLYTNIILNYFENELDGQFNGAKGKEGLESYIFSPDGFFEDIKFDDLNETSENLPEYKEAIKSVLEGKRVLPGNIRKYASISEIERINTKGKEYTKGEDIINHLESGKTIVYLKDGTKYVYYDIGLPTYFVIPGGDKPEEGEAWYDIMNGELHLYGETYNISGIEGETK